MATLTGQTVASTYDLLLKVAATGIDPSTPRTIQDGTANNSALKLAGASVQIKQSDDSSATLEVTGVSTLTGAVTATGGVVGDLTGNADTATKAYVTDNESTNEENLISFVADAATASGNHGLEMDGNLTYNPSTGTITATAVASALTGNVAGNVTGNVTGSSGSCTGNSATATALAATGNIAMTGDVAWNVDFSGSGVTAAGTIQANAVDLSMLEDGTQGDVLYYGASGAPARLAAGTAGQVLESGGAAANPSWADRVRGIDTFESDGTFTVPATVTAVKVTVVGGGGGGMEDSNAGTKMGGGAGGAAIKAITGLTPGADITVVVGAGGAVNVAGGDSNFGGYCSATGGEQGGSSVAYGGGGAGASGDTNFTGESGLMSSAGGSGGGSIFGGGGRWRVLSSYGVEGNATTYGGGGAGGQSTVYGVGFDGVVIVEY